MASREVRSAPETDPLVTVIVPCYNSARTIRACLQSLLRQDTAVPFEILVVDSSEDETPQIVEREFPSVRLIRFPRRTFAGAARNAGVRASRSPFCLMLDSDCVAFPDMIERMLARHAEGAYAAVGGALRQESPMSAADWVAYHLEFREFMPACPRRTEASVPTAIIMYRREVFERHGGYDDDMRLSEDVLFHWGLHKAGERILFDPAIEVLHCKHARLGEMLAYQRDLGEWSARARNRAGLPVHTAIRFPPLAFTMPFVRLAKAARWLFRHDRRSLGVLCLRWPLYLAGAAIWSRSFFHEARKGLPCHRGNLAPLSRPAAEARPADPTDALG